MDQVLIKMNKPNKNSESGDDDKDADIEMCREDDKDDDDGDDDDDENSVYLSLDKRNEQDDHDNVIERCESKDSVSDYNIRGECVICFENFKECDVIVQSEIEYCRHVYHKECIVSYFAANLDDPSCPTCRKRFCTHIMPESTN